MRRLTLVGLMGSGKSTVSRLLGERWGWQPVDLDDEIAARAGTSVAEVFATRGEAAFRRLEGEALRDVLGRDRCVVATGGGAPAQPGAMDAICAAGPSAWLRGRPETLAARALAAGGRPLLDGRDLAGATRVLADQLSARQAHYQRATVAVDVDGLAPAAVADRVEADLAALGALP